jgi:tetratricopeptide (TPR) repeat protein
MALSRTVNIRLLLVLLVVFVVLGVSVHFVHGFNVRRSASALRERGEKAEGDGKYGEAASWYRRYCDIDPNNLDAWLKWGHALEQKKDKSAPEWMELFNVYENVLWRDPKQHEVRRKSVDVALLVRKVDHAIDSLGVLVKSTAQNDAKMEQLLAELLTGVKRDDAMAREWFEKAIEHDPHHLPGFIGLARMWRRLKRDDDADKIMRKMIQANRDKYEAHLVLADHLQKRGKPLAEVEKEVEEALKQAPDKAEPHMAAARLAWAKKDFKRARTELEAALKIQSDRADAYLLLAEIERLTRRPEQAITVLKTGLDKVPAQNKRALRHNLALLLIQDNQIGEAKEIIDTLEKAGASELEVEELRARLDVHNQKWPEAVKKLENLHEKYLARTDDSRLTEDAQAAVRDRLLQIHLLLGQCYQKLNKLEDAEKAYSRALTLAGASPAAQLTAHLGLGDINTAKQDYIQAKVHYTEATTIDPRMATKLVQVLILRNRQLDPERRNEIEKALKDAIAAVPNALEVQLLEVELLVGQNKLKDAQTRLEEILKNHPKRLDVWLSLVNVVEIRVQSPVDPVEPKAILGILDEAKKELGDRVELRLARAAYWLRHDGPAAKEALAEVEKKAAEDDKAQLFLGLAQTYFRFGKLEETKRLLTQLEVKDPKNLDVLRLHMDLAMQADDEPAIKKMAATIQDVAGKDSLLGRYAQACDHLTLARKGSNKDAELAKAKPLLEAVVAQRPGWSPALLRQGQLFDLEGNYADALKRYEEFLAADANSGVLRRATQLILLSDRPDRYQKAERWIKQIQSLDDSARKALPSDLIGYQIQILLAKKDLEKARELLDELIAKAKKPEPSHFMLQAQILSALKKDAQAEKSFRKALDLPGAKENPDVWYPYFQFRFRTGGKAKALEVLQEEGKHLPAEVRPLALARSYEALGETAKAREQYQAALKDKPEDLQVLRNVAAHHWRHQEFKDAAPLLRKIADPETKASPAEVRWARRGLAMGQAASGDNAQYRDALQIIEKNLQEGGGAVEDRRAKAMLLARSAFYRRQALRTFEETLGSSLPLSLDELVTLAGLYEQQPNQWPNALKIYKVMAEQEGQTPSVILFCAGKLLQHGDGNVATVRPWLEKLEKIDPAAIQKPEKLGTETLQLLSLWIRVYKAEGKGKEAAALAEAYQRRAPKGEMKREILAALLEESGQIDKADALYRQLAAENPNDYARQLAVVEFLRRQNRLPDALDFAGRLWENHSLEPEVVADLCMRLLHAYDKRTPEQCEEVLTRLKEALKKKPQSPGLLSQEAALYSLLHQYDAVETTYRQLFSQDRTNPIVLNNLAWVMAARDPTKAPEALELINRALARLGPVAELLDTRAFIYLRMNEIQSAMKDLNAAIADSPSPTMFFHLALAHAKANERGSARANLDKATKDPKFKVNPPEQKDYEDLLEWLKATEQSKR